MQTKPEPLPDHRRAKEEITILCISQNQNISAMKGIVLAGGSGTLMGTLLGCLIIGIIGNILNLVGVNSYYQLIVKGVVIVAAIYIDIAKNRLVVRKGKR